MGRMMTVNMLKHFGEKKKINERNLAELRLRRSVGEWQGEGLCGCKGVQ